MRSICKGPTIRLTGSSHSLPLRVSASKASRLLLRLNRNLTNTVSVYPAPLCFAFADSRYLVNVERVITVVFDIEILWRFIATSPQWRNFFLKKRNVGDLILSLVCTIIIIPPIPNTEAYKWLTAFQLARFYRAILIVPGMRSLLVSA